MPGSGITKKPSIRDIPKKRAATKKKRKPIDLFNLGSLPTERPDELTLFTVIRDLLKKGKK